MLGICVGKVEKNASYFDIENKHTAEYILVTEIQLFQLGHLQLPQLFWKQRDNLVATDAMIYIEKDQDQI